MRSIGEKAIPAALAGLISHHVLPRATGLINREVPAVSHMCDCFFIYAFAHVVPSA